MLTNSEKKKISEFRTGIKLSNSTKLKISLAATKLRGVAVIVNNTKTGENTVFDSLTEAASNLNVSRTAVKNCLKSGKLLQNIFLIKEKK